jgi:hypothetical protein
MSRDNWPADERGVIHSYERNTTMKNFIKSIAVAVSIGVLSAGLATTSFAGLKVLEFKKQNHEIVIAQNSGSYGQTSHSESRNDGREYKSDEYAEQSAKPYDHNEDSYDSDSRPYDYAVPANSCSSDSGTLQAKLDLPQNCSLEL